MCFKSDDNDDDSPIQMHTQSFTFIKTFHIVQLGPM